jgi:hypothetical protein
VEELSTKIRKNDKKKKVEGLKRLGEIKVIL